MKANRENLFKADLLEVSPVLYHGELRMVSRQQNAIV
jgi:hypothetical protein